MNVFRHRANWPDCCNLPGQPVLWCSHRVASLALWLVWLLTGPLPAGYAQQPEVAIGWPPVQQLGVGQGLPQAFVSSVIQDDDGFLWVATLGGLTRYDGQKMVPFLHRANDPASPTSNGVDELIRGSAHQLWVLYENNMVDRLDTRTGRCQRLALLSDSLRALAAFRLRLTDRQGTLWGVALNRGLFCYQPRQNKVVRYTRATNMPGLVSDTITTLVADRRGCIWAISPAGLSYIAPGQGLIRSIRFATPARDLLTITQSLDRVEAFIRPNGTIVVNTRTQLLLIDPATGAIRRFPFASRPTIDQPLLHQSADGQLFLLAANTLYRYNDAAGARPGLSVLWQFTTSQSAQSDVLLGTSLILDRSGVLWLGANTRGLFRIDLAAAPIQAFRNRITFCADALQTGLGLALPSFFNWPFDNLRVQSSYAFRTDYDRAGNLWMSIGNEVGYYSFSAKTFTKLPNPAPGRQRGLESYLWGLSMAPDGQLWVASHTGTVHGFDATRGQWETFSFSSNPAVLRKTLINDLQADEKALWLTSSTQGLLRFDRRTHQWQTLYLQPRPVNGLASPLMDIYQDERQPHYLWIGTYNGLIRFDKRTRRYRLVTMANGLPNNTVYAIRPDRQHRLWLSTNRGLCRFDPANGSTLVVGLTDGLPGEEFNRYHSLSFPDGRLAFGGIDGWVLFDPDQIRTDTDQPHVAISSLTINNQPADSLGRPTDLPQLFNTLRALRLAYDQNYLTVNFTALNYHQPSRVTYRYRLQGYDADWTRTTQPTASYTKLPPGTYTLQINAANSVGQWSPQIRTVSLSILAPPWASGWAYSLYALLLGSAGLGVIRFRAARSRERRELAMRQRQADELRQLDADKTRFFTNVSHELRTPLTLMLGPLSSVLNRHQIDGHDEQLLRTAERNARQLLRLVNELLELTRPATAQPVLQPQAVPLNGLLRQCLSFFDTTARQTAITLRAELGRTEGLTVLLDGHKLDRVMQNLLANACKFTPPGGTITLRTDTMANQLRLWVIDTGRGIHPADLPYVFERYFQTRQPDAPLEGGTGIGLALCQELVRLMQGSLTVDSTPGKGSAFCVTLPLSTLPGKATVADAPAVAEDDSMAGPEPLAEADPASLMAYPRARILLVEDNPDLRDYLTTVLSPSFDVLAAANGQAALNRLADLQQLPNLLISDIMMPVMDGFQLLTALKAHPRYRLIPVVMLTARSETGDKLRALRLGVDDYLLKPFDEAELLARVSALLQHQRQRHEAAQQPDAGDRPGEPTGAPSLSADELAWLEQLETIITGRVGQFDLVADELADELAMTRRTFYRTIKRLTGLTPAQYVAEARFSTARHLLETRQVSSVKQVAHRVGYRHVSHFSQLYQQRFGKNPADYL